MSKVLLSNRDGAMHLKPVNGKPRVWAGHTTIKVDDDEAAKLLKYKHVVELGPDGKQLRPADEVKPVPAGSGVGPEAQVPGKKKGA